MSDESKKTAAERERPVTALGELERLTIVMDRIDALACAAEQMFVDACQISATVEKRRFATVLDVLIDECKKACVAVSEAIDRAMGRAPRQEQEGV